MNLLVRVRVHVLVPPAEYVLGEDMNGLFVVKNAEYVIDEKHVSTLIHRSTTHKRTYALASYEYTVIFW